jgi:hypothetical protein
VVPLTSHAYRRSESDPPSGVHQHSERTRNAVPWVVVGVILAGVIIAALGLMALRPVVIIAGAAVVAAGLLLAVALPKTGLSHPVSFAADAPSQTPGPRATDDGRPRPPIDTDPDAVSRRPPDLSPYKTVAQAPASELPQTPDPDRAKPQYVNLPPGERIRRIGGQDVVEIPDESPEDL